MYAPSFDYYRAGSVADAQRLLAAHPGAKLLAGGHSLVPLLKLRLAAPPALIDIGRIPELQGISRQGDSIRIGALTTHAELAASADVRSAAPALAEAAAIGRRSRGQEPRHDRRQRRARRSGVRSADRAGRARRALSSRPAPAASGRSRRRRVLRGDHDDGAGRRRNPGRRSTCPRPAAARVRPTRSSLIRRRATPSSAPQPGSPSPTARAGAARVALGGLLPHARRVGSVEKALVGKALTAEAIAAAAAQVAADLGNDVQRATSTRRPNTAPRWRPCSRKRAIASGRGASVADLTTTVVSASECSSKLAIPASVDDLQQALARSSTSPDRGLAVSIYLALRLQRPLFLEGEPASARPRSRKCWRRRSTPS